MDDDTVVKATEEVCRGFSYDLAFLYVRFLQLHLLLQLADLLVVLIHPVIFSLINSLGQLFNQKAEVLFLALKVVLLNNALVV